MKGQQEGVNTNFSKTPCTHEAITTKTQVPAEEVALEVAPNDEVYMGSIGAFERLDKGSLWEIPKSYYSHDFRT